MYRTVRTIRGMAGPITFTSAEATGSSKALSIATAANPGGFTLIQQATAAAAGPISQASTFDDDGMGSGSGGPGPGPGPGSSGGPGPVEVPQEVRDRCACLVENAVVPALEAQGASVTDAMAQVFAASCASDPEAFVENLDRQGIDHDGCKPWYQRRVTKYAAGGALALGLLYLVVRR